MAQSVQRKVPTHGSSIQCPKFKPNPNPVSLKKGVDAWPNQSREKFQDADPVPIVQTKPSFTEERI